MRNHPPDFLSRHSLTLLDLLKSFSNTGNELYLRRNILTRSIFRQSLTAWRRHVKGWRMRGLCGADEQTLGKGYKIGGEAFRSLPVERVPGAFVHDKPRTRMVVRRTF